MLAVPGIVLTPTIMITIAGMSDAYLSWAVSAALVVSGLATAIQAKGIGQVGAGYVLLMGSSSAFLPVCIAALEQGGPGLLASLILVSSLFQFALAAKLSLVRKIFTPTVAGTVLMLIPITIAPAIVNKLNDLPEGASPLAGPVSAGVTLLIIVSIALRFSGTWRLWAPVIGITTGSVISGLAFGLYDTASVINAPWVGLPTQAFGGIDLSFGASFWALLPPFVFVTMVGAMDTLGDTIAIQRVAWRKPRAIDFRSVQGAIYADGIGNVLAGLAGTTPNTTAASSISIAEITGVASRSVGLWVGVILASLALFPKFIAVMVAIPSPVVAGYLIVLIGLLFIFGLKIILQDGLDYRQSLIVGMAFWLGTAFQLGMVYPEQIPAGLSGVLGNGMTVGGTVVILMTIFVNLTGQRRRCLQTSLKMDAYPKVDEFLVNLAMRNRWNREMAQRVRAVGEETFLLLVGEKAEAARHLLLLAHGDGETATLEFIAATDESNIEDRMALLNERNAEGPAEDEVSLRLLRHYASAVRHQQFHDTDVVTVRVEPVADRTE